MAIHPSHPPDVSVGSTIFRYISIPHAEDFRIRNLSTAEERQGFWKQRWEPFPIVSETSRSWVVGVYRTKEKIAKNEPLPQCYAWDETSIDERVAAFEKTFWVNAHRYKISQAVQGVDYETLQDIAKRIGYEPW